MIDTHSHIYDEAFDTDFDAVVDRASAAGVDMFIMPGIDSSCHKRMMDCAARLKQKARPAVGLHPTSVDDGWKKELAFVESRLGERGWTAIGEIGIDAFHSKTYMDEQEEVFRTQVIWACQLGLPVIIHVRDAADRVFAVLDGLRRKGIVPSGVFHAFSGSIETYRRIRSYGGFKVGIGGVVTFKNASIAATLKEIPLEDILLETDAPWLAPVPYRGKRNEPAYMAIVAGKVAEIKGCSVAAVEKTTEENAINLFNIKKDTAV